MIIDAHAHLWKKQDGRLGEKSVYAVGGGKSKFGDEIRQMQPPYMFSGENPVEQFIANMDYARVHGAVITQEYIDGNQDSYLLEAKKQFPKRIKICSLFEEDNDFRVDGFDGIKICAGRLRMPLSDTLPVFKVAEKLNMFVSIDLAEGDAQVAALEKIIKKCPEVKIAIGHFGMANHKDWEKQIELACNPNVYIESGGITWLFHQEFYPYPSAIEAIRLASEICGIHKLMWGSDYPRTMTAITYRMSLDFILKSTSLTETEKKLFLGENAAKFYNFTEFPNLPYIKNMVED